MNANDYGSNTMTVSVTHCEDTPSGHGVCAVLGAIHVCDVCTAIGQNRGADEAREESKREEHTEIGRQGCWNQKQDKYRQSDHVDGQASNLRDLAVKSSDSRSRQRYCNENH